MRDARQADAGLSQTRSPASCGQRADVFLGQPGVQQGRGDTVLLRSLLSRPEVALVVDVHAVGDRVKALLLADTAPSR